MEDPQGLDRYVYVGNNPSRYNDPSGHWTIGPCAGGSLGSLIFGTANACYIVASNGDIGIVYTYGGGGNTGPTGGAGLQIQASNGTSINDLLGPFGTVGLSGGEVVGISGDVFFGKTTDCQPRRIWGIQVGAGATIKAPLPLEFHGGVTTTKVYGMINVPDTVRGAWNDAEQYVSQWLQSWLPSAPPAKPWWQR